MEPAYSAGAPELSEHVRVVLRPSCATNMLYLLIESQSHDLDGSKRASISIDLALMPCPQPH